MIITVKSMENKFWKRILQHAVYLAIVLILIPLIVFFELCIVLPEVFEVGSLEYFIHMTVAFFLILNIVGNLIYGAMTNTTIKGKLIIVNTTKDSEWTSCPVCECLRPPRAWHCEYCDICVLKRDHHCTFLACCVGYYNHRYFMMLTFYLFVAMLYAFYYNIVYISSFVNWNYGLVILKFVFPLASFFIDFGNESIYVLVIVINVLIAVFSGFLFIYHMKNVLNGQTVHEMKHSTNKNMYDKGWRSNVEEVFGTRWRVAWILPFIHSPLPGNGIEWDSNNKYK